jgi:hypothetical protein
MITEPRTRPASRLLSGLRDVLVVVLLVVAVVWPLVNVGPRGPTLLAITWNHGIDARDLLATIPFALAVALLYSRKYSRKL